MDQDYRKAFDAYYYAHDCGLPYERNEQWLNFFGGIAERIVQEINPKTELDAGCAMGFLVEGSAHTGGGRLGGGCFGICHRAGP